MTFNTDCKPQYFFRKKIRTIAVPYLFAGFISVLIFHFLGNLAGKSLGEDLSSTGLVPNILALVYGNAKGNAMKWNNSLWFLPCLFMAETLIYLFCSAVRAGGKEAGGRSLAPFAVVCGGAGLYLTQMHPHLHLAWHLETALCNIPFIVPGMLYKDFLKSRNEHDTGRVTVPYNIIKPIIFICAAVLLSVINGQSSARTDEYGLSYPVYMAAALCYCSAYLSAGRVLSHRLTAMAYAGRNTLPVLLWNKFPIMAIQMIPAFSHMISNPDSPVTLILCTVPSIAVIFFCIICGRIQKTLLPWTI
jgi:fucose 4-O-acetylase-like acetyltransferase